MRLAVINSSNSALDDSLGYDGQDFVYEGLSGSRTRRYVRGPGVDEPLVAYLVTPGSATTRLWYQADERGSIVRLSNDSGVGGIGKFDEYGVGGSGRFRYAGQYWLADGSLTYSRARIYDARLGRFLQPDPIGYGGGMNMYAYVKGDPVNLIDPSGLQDEPDIIITGHCGILCKIARALSHNIGGGSSDSSGGFERSWGTPSAPAPSNGGRVGGARPKKPAPKPDKTEPEDPCAGSVRAEGVNATGILGLGVTVSVGKVTVNGSGESSWFVSLGVGAGLEAGVSGFATRYNDLSSFAGYAESYNGSIPIAGRTVGYSRSYDVNGNHTGDTVSGSGVPGLPGVKAGASGTATDTTLLNGKCKP